MCCNTRTAKECKREQRKRTYAKCVVFIRKRSLRKLRLSNSWGVNLVVKDMNKVLECVRVKSLRKLKHVTRTSTLMVYKKVDVRVGNTKKKRELFLKRKIEKCVSILRRDLSRIWFVQETMEKWQCWDKHELKRKCKAKGRSFDSAWNWNVKRR